MAIVKVWDDVYTEEELEGIWHVLNQIQERGLWDTEERVGSSTEKESGRNKRSGKAAWLGGLRKRKLPDDLHYVNETVAKLFNQGYTADYSEGGLFEKGILLTNSHENLLSYYEDGDRYLAHWDASPYTALTWFCKEPQAFTGGDLFFPELNDLVPFRNNRTVLFPGHLFHEVVTVNLPPDLANQGFGRYCLTQFLNIDPQMHAAEEKK